MLKAFKSQKSMMSKKYLSMLLGGTLTMMVVALLLMSDSVIAGIMIGPDAVAGITLVLPIYSFASFLSSVFSLGIPIVYSTKMGQFDKKEADRSFGLGFLMSVAVGVTLFILSTVFGNYYLNLNSPSAAVLSEAKGYFYWIRFSMMLLPLVLLISAMVYNDGDELISTLANGVQGIGNIISSLLLSRVMGIRGIGLSSFLFNAISLAILFTHFLKKNNSLKINLFFSWKMLKEVVRYSIIDSSTYLFISILTAVLNAFVSARFGPRYLIVVSAIALCRELQLLFDGIGEALTPIMGVYYGEENKEGIKRIYRLAERTAIAEGIVVMVLLLLFAPLIPGVLNIKDAELVRYVTTEIRIISAGSVFVSLLYLLTSYYLIIDRIALGLIVSGIRDVLFSAVLGVVLGSAFGPVGLFIGLAAAPAAGYIILMIYISKRYGKQEFPLLLSGIASGSRSYIFDLYAEPKEIINLQKKVERLLAENNTDSRTIGRVKLLIEELYMLIYEKNDKVPVLCECSVFLSPTEVRLIIKDDGKLFDISEDDITVTTLASFAVSSYMEKLGRNRRHLTTMSFNRSSFLIKRQGQ